MTMWLWSYRIYFCPIASTIHFPLHFTHESKTFWKPFAIKGVLCTFGSCIDGFFLSHRKVTCKGTKTSCKQNLLKSDTERILGHITKIFIEIPLTSIDGIITEKKSRCSLVHFFGVTYRELTFPEVAPELTRDYLVPKSSMH